MPPACAQRDRACEEGRFVPKDTSVLPRKPRHCALRVSVLGISGELPVTQRTPSSTGSFCRGLGLQSASGECPAGFLCAEGSKSPVDPFSRCRPGGYCPRGAQKQKACPVGHTRTLLGARSEKDCDPCPPGRVCKADGSSKPCNEGSFCPGADKKPVSCTKGHFCPAGAARARPCPAGQLQPTAGQASCINCSEGHTCLWTKGKNGCDKNLNLGIETEQLCPQGFACPSGKMPAPCAAGLYAPVAGKGCIACPKGFFCTGEPSGKVSGTCAPGYRCPASSRPTGDSCPNIGFCSAGKLQECEKGYYAARSGLQRKEDCSQCPPGSLCGAKVQPCPAGSFCRKNDSNPCTAGFACREGVADPQRCSAGFQPSNNQQTCEDCSAGKYCPGKTLSVTALSVLSLPSCSLLYRRF